MENLFKGFRLWELEAPTTATPMPPPMKDKKLPKGALVNRAQQLIPIEKKLWIGMPVLLPANKPIGKYTFPKPVAFVVDDFNDETVKLKRVADPYPIDMDKIDLADPGDVEVEVMLDDFYNMQNLDKMPQGGM